MAAVNSTADNYLENVDGRWLLKIGITVGYSLCFAVGFCGNCLVIAMIINIFLTLRPAATSQHSTKHVFIYVLGLSVVDLFVVAHLPFLITDLLLKNWIFGSIMCKVYWIGECVNKILSTFILTALSWDRFLAICRPMQSSKYRRVGVAVSVLLVCAVVAVLLLTPVHLYAEVEECYLQNQTEIIFCVSDGTNVTGFIEQTTLQVTKLKRCAFYTGSTVWFLTGIFLSGYCIPGFLMVFFYSMVLFQLRKMVMQDHSAKVKKVTLRILCVIIFYFVCWTPYWLLTWMDETRLIQVDMRQFMFVTLFYLAHLLICLNSTMNPILYALLNQELRIQHAIALENRRKSWSNVTKVTVEMFQKQGVRLLEAASAVRSRSGSILSQF